MGIGGGSRRRNGGRRRASRIGAVYAVEVAICGGSDNDIGAGEAGECIDVNV